MFEPENPTLQLDIPSGQVRGTFSQSLLARVLRRKFFDMLQDIREGVLRVVEGTNEYSFGRGGAQSELKATIWILSPSFFTNLASRGSLGAGESYMKGHWTTDDLTAAVQIFARNRQILETVDSGWVRLLSPGWKIIHGLRKNTRSGSRRNIAEHYDLGNDFFSIFLDKTMMYSSAYFEDGVTSLRQASTAKIDRICRKLQLRPEEHLLEIGTGWGSFAIHAAREYGCKVTTTTVSQAQFDHATERVKRLGLSDRVTILLEDYRDLQGQFDKFVSIEMIEAVGLDYLEGYFTRCNSLLRKGGLGLIQAITMAEEFFHQSRQSVDFIQKYIFPGSEIPSVNTLTGIMKNSTDLCLLDLEDITIHYAKTLKLWRERFLKNIAEIRQMGFQEQFVRMWEFYFCYCEAGFRERHIEDVQLLFEKK